MADIIEIEGVGEVYRQQLEAVGVGTVEALLKLCATAKGRCELARKTGISEKLVLRWTNQADLLRVRGIAGQYAELLEAAGVDTVPELAYRNAENLQKILTEKNLEMHKVRVVPTAAEVLAWIEDAKTLPRAVET